MSEQPIDALGTGHRYLLCHANIEHDQTADIPGSEIGVYSDFGEGLDMVDALAILGEDMPPVYVIPHGECPEFNLAPLDDDQARRWEDHCSELLDDRLVDMLDEDEIYSLTDYVAKLKGEHGDVRLRLICCTGATDASRPSAKAGAPKSWQRTSITVDTRGRIMDKRTESNNIMKQTLQLCKNSWLDAVALLDDLSTGQIAAIGLRNDTGAFIVKSWQAWKVIPPEQDPISGWQEFLERLTPDPETAGETYKAWKVCGDGLPSLAGALAAVFHKVDGLLVPGSDGYEKVAAEDYVTGFLSTGWATERPPAGEPGPGEPSGSEEDPDPDVVNEFEAALLSPGETGAGPDTGGRGIKRPRSPGDDT